MLKTDIKRVFFGIPVPKKLTEQMIRACDKQNPEILSMGRWVKLENAHVTIRFLGGVSSKTITSLIETLTQRLVNFSTSSSSDDVSSSLSIPIKNIIRFPSSKGRIIAAEVSLTEPLETLFATIESSVITLCLSPETRAFSPHITLCRLKKEDLRGLYFEMIAMNDCVVPMKELILYESQSLKGGSVYVPLHYFNLKTKD